MEHLTLPDQAFQPYLDKVARGLKVLPEAERSDVLRELASHLEDGRAAGESPETLMERMGAPETVAAALVQERQVAVDRQRSSLELLGLTLQAAFLPLLAVIAVLVAVDLAVVTVFRPDGPLNEFISHTGVLIFFILPFGMLMLGAFGLPKLHRELSPELFQRVLPRFCAAVMGLALLMTVAGYSALDGWWTGNPADRGRLAQSQQAIATLVDEQRALSPTNASQPTRATRLKLQSVEDRLNLERMLHSVNVTMPAFPLGVAALGLVLGYACRRAAFTVTAIVAGLAVVGQVAAAGITVTGSLAAQWLGTFSWPGILLQWFLVMTALVVALFLDRSPRHVQ